jgi:RNA polymerase sigma-70 factor (ECF subfamily)
VAANVISERRRAERRRLRAMERLASQAPRGTVEAPEDLDPRLIAGLRQLEAADREALLLVAWGELSYQEAAEALQIPVGTVRSRIARARGQLQSVTPRRASTLPCRAETRGFNV